ncbi:MAG: histidinol phosphatase [Actinomycetota bacterium]|nr:MAG: histidinol phosphatase [Actinomycetota bacterium]
MAGAGAGAYAADLALALRLADAADEVTLARFRAADLTVSAKPDLTPVTDVDLAIERLVRDTLAQQRPADDVLGEEYGDGSRGAPPDHTRPARAGRCWIVDPIDGTKNYVRGVPVWATLIALVADGRVVLGVASAPALGRRWWAAAGQGAWCTEPATAGPRRLRVSAVAELGDASFSYSDDRGWDVRGAEPGLAQLIRTCWRTRAYGDFWSHVLVAEGAVDLAAEPELSPWDVAALIPIVEEAGGTIGGYDGTSYGGDPDALGRAGTLTSNGLLHAAAVRVLDSGS